MILGLITTDVDNPFPYQAVPVGLRPTRIDTTIDNGRLARTEFDYETFTYNYHPWDHYNSGPAPVQTYTTSRGNVTQIREYDYGSPGSGAPGPLLRRTDNAYLHNSNGNYLTYNIVNKVLSQTVYDGVGNQVAQRQYEYDGTFANWHLERASTRLHELLDQLPISLATLPG